VCEEGEKEDHSWWRERGPSLPIYRFDLNFVETIIKDDIKD
jgi:hypothetical protein